MCALPKMKQLSKGQKWFVYYLLGYFVLNVIQDIIFLGFGSRNLFVNYFFSLIDCLFIFKVYQQFFHKQLRSIPFIFGICFLVLLIDLFWVTGFRNEENLFSQTIISVCIFGVSMYYLASLLLNKAYENLFNELNLYIALGLMIKSFLKSIFSFFKNYLYETESNGYIIAEADNFYSYFTIVILLLVSWAFYNLKAKTIDE